MIADRPVMTTAPSRSVRADELALAPSRLALVDLGHPALRSVARPIEPSAFGSAALHSVVARMWRALDEIGHGVGLAAPQVGLDVRLFIIDDGEGHRFAMVNPRRIGLPSLERETTVEGCLSIPGFWAQVSRPTSRTVEGFDADGQPLRVVGQGYLARILEHESDHLDGKLYVDRMDPTTFGPEPRGVRAGQRIWDTRAAARRSIARVRGSTRS